MDTAPSVLTLACPLSSNGAGRVTMAHGGGGRLTQQLIERIFLPAFANDLLCAQHDGASMEIRGARLAFTTDSYVVRPLVFPGGTIGDLAVNGTVNDLAMCGARPLYLSAGFILEEGLPMETLQSVVESMRSAAERAGVQIVTGDTKVVDRGACDGMYINTSGVGVREWTLEIGPASVQPGDAVLVSGPLGAHGIAVLSVRDGLEFEGPVESDTAPLWKPVESLLQAGIEVRCLRDLTRGGLASAVNEIAGARRVGMRLEESLIPVDPVVRGACEILGFDPLYVANEGRFLAIVPGRQAGCAVQALRSGSNCSQAEKIGEVLEGPAGTVFLRSRIGGNRVLDMLSGEQLPRIC